jgi:hypothetical protein
MAAGAHLPRGGALSIVQRAGGPPRADLPARPSTLQFVGGSSLVDPGGGAHSRYPSVLIVTGRACWSRCPPAASFFGRTHRQHRQARGQSLVLHAGAAGSSRWRSAYDMSPALKTRRPLRAVRRRSSNRPPPPPGRRPLTGPKSCMGEPGTCGPRSPRPSGVFGLPFREVAAAQTPPRSAGRAEQSSGGCWPRFSAFCSCGAQLVDAAGLRRQGDGLAGAADARGAAQRRSQVASVSLPAFQAKASS